jgi:signal peptidase II
MVALAVVVILLDQWTKSLIVGYFGVPYVKPPIPIFGPVLELQYIRNTGVAFSLLEGQAVLFVFIAIAIIVIGVLYWRLRETAGLLMKLTFGLILGGAFGNLLDRFRQAYVVDFIHFQIPGRFDFPVFNLADSAISIGVVALAVLLWRGAPGATHPGPAQGSPPQPASARPARSFDEKRDERQSPAATASGLATPRVRNPNARSG